nr:uncharacterized mitochondrial protein AtMg00810-like [Tanacetum cinerariifolium]
MTDYSLWEVILNGHSPAPTRVVEGVLQPVAPTTAEQKLARKNELKAHGTLLMALPDKHQLKFNSHKDAKTLMEAIKKRFGGSTETKKVQKTLLKQQYENFTGFSSESLDQIHDRLQKLVSQLEIHGVSLFQDDVNLKFLRSLPSEWKTHMLIWRNKADLEEQNLDDLFNSLKIYEAEVKIIIATSVFAVCAKMHVSSLPNVDSLRNAMIYSFFASQSSSPQLDNEDLKHIDVDDLEEMDLKWQMAMKGYFARECRSPKDSRRNGAVEPQRRKEEPANYALMAFSSSSSSSDNEALESVEARLLVYKQNDFVFEEDIKLLKLEVFTRAMFDCDDYLSSESDESWPSSSLYDRFQPGDEYHAVPLPYTGTFMPPKPDLVFNTAPTDVETDHPAFTIQLSPTKPDQDLSLRNRPSSPIIKDYHLIKDFDYHEKKMAQPTARNHAHRGHHKHYAPMTHLKSQKHMVPAAVLTQSKPVPITAVRPVSDVVAKLKMNRPRHAKPIVTKLNSPTRRHITCSPTLKPSNSPPRVIAVKAPMVNAAQGLQGKWEWRQCSVLDYVSCNTIASMTLKRVIHKHALKDKGVINSGCSRTPQENGIANRKNMTLIEAARTMLADSLLPIPFWAEVVNTACYVQNRVIVTKPHNKTPYELLHGGTPSIGFMRPFGCPVTILNTLDSLGKFEGKVDEGFLVGYSVSSKSFRVFNSRTRIVQETLHVNFLENKPNVACFQDKFDAEKTEEEIDQQYVLFPVWSSGSTNPQNTNRDAAFDGKEPKFDEKKPESKVNVSSSSSAQSRKQDDKTKKEAKGKSLVESFTEYRDLSTEYEDCSDNSINEVNAAGTLVPTVGLTHGKSSFINASQLLDDPDMPELEDITYYDNEDDVGAEANFNNFETSITDSHIPTTRVHKDHPITQIIGLQVKQKKDGIFISHDKYVAEILRKFRLIEGKSASTPIDTEKPLLKDPDVKKIFRYLKGKPHLGLWYPKDSPFDLVAYSDSDYVGTSLDRKSTTGGCQFLGCRLIYWQFKKQTVVATSSTKVEYVAAASCCAQVLWIQNQLLDYGSTVKYALTVNLNIYVSCIKQFWTTFVVKKVNDVIRLQALVDKKKVVVTKATIREALYLDDAEGVECLPNEEIFAELARMGYEKPSTNLHFTKHSSEASGRRKFNFSKYIFDSMVRNVDSPTKFYMYPHFLQLIIRKQVGDLSTHTTKYTSSALTQKVFANMRRVGDADENDENVNVGDVVEGYDSAAHGEVPTVAEEPSIPSPTPPTPPPQPSHDIHSTSQRVETSNETMMDDVSSQGRMIAEMDQDADVVLEDDKEGRIAKSQTEIYKIDLDHANKVLSMHEDETEPAEVQEVVDVVTTAKIITEVVTAASETVTAASTNIIVAEAQVHVATLTAAPARVTAGPSRRRKRVVIRDLQEESHTFVIILAETKSRDKGKGILVEEPKPLKKKQQIKQDEQYARELQAELNKNIDWDEAIDHVKRKAKEDSAIEEDENRALKRLNNTLAERATKRQKLDEEIIELNNKPYYKIIRADDTHQLYVSFMSLLRNFDREDLEALWSLVKERFSTTKPKNFSDDFLLFTLGAMFEKPNIHAQIWKNQRSVNGPTKEGGAKEARGLVKEGGKGRRRRENERPFLVPPEPGGACGRGVPRQNKGMKGRFALDALYPPHNDGLGDGKEGILTLSLSFSDSVFKLLIEIIL